MSAIEACRTEALGGHVAGCTKCGHHHIAYNSCKNRHCPKCQGPAARDWMEARAEDLLPVEDFHVVFTLPAEIARIAYWNPKAVYGLLFRASAQTVTTIAADPKRLGAKVGMTGVLHTWGSALTHHPHIHMIVPGGGLSPDGTKWVACKPGFFLHVRVLARLFRRLFLEGLMELHCAGQLTFFGDLDRLAQAGHFAHWLAPFRKTEWVVYAKPPFGGPEAVLASSARKTNITKIRALLGAHHAEETIAQKLEHETTSLTLHEPCPCCGGPMRIIEIFRRGQMPMSRAPPREQAA